MKAASFLVLVALAALTGCSTPQAVLDEANLSIGMMGDLKKQVVNYKQVQSAEDQYRNQVLVTQRERLIKLNAGLEEFTPELVAPAVKVQALTFQRLRKVSDLRAARIAAGPVKVDLKLIDALPDVEPQLNASQVAMAPLGAEFSSRERINNAKAFVDEIRKGVKDDLKKIEDAEKNAAAKPDGAAQ